jgi:hypothetical protein
MQKKQLINGKCYDWSSVTISIPGAESMEPTEISYNDEQEHDGVYGKKGRYRGYGTGNYKASVSLTMLREDYEELQRLAKAKGYKSIYDYVIPKIVVSYADTGASTVTDTLTNIVFGKRDTGAKNGDKSITMKLDGTPYGGIKWNGMQ